MVVHYLTISVDKLLKWLNKEFVHVSLVDKYEFYFLKGFHDFYVQLFSFKCHMAVYLRYFLVTMKQALTKLVPVISAKRKTMLINTIIVTQQPRNRTKVKVGFVAIDPVRFINLL